MDCYPYKSSREQFSWGELLRIPFEEIDEPHRCVIQKAEDGDIWIVQSDRHVYMDILLDKKRRLMVGFLFHCPVQREEVMCALRDFVPEVEAEKFVDRIVNLVTIIFLGKR